MKKLRKMLCIAIAGLALFATTTVTALAAQKQTIYNSPYVSFAPDGMAWTTNAGDTNTQWYEEGTTVSTGISSVLRVLRTGEHYYQYARTGEIPIGEWRVKLRSVDCCHNGYPLIDDYHGIDYNKNLCLRDHYSGWFSYCADCGQEIYHAYFYMSREAAESIDYIEVGEGEKEYYYLCPFCDNLEQGTGFKSHRCLAISCNQYKVVYDGNTTQTVGGYMADSYHMYNNATMYDGEPVTPITHLTPNAYTRIGYEFVEWNTKSDGSGTSYQDGQEILNLTDEDEGTVILYAQWRNSAGILQINPNGGSYNGRTAITTVTGSYGNRYTLMNNTIVPPRGYKVSFNTNGGNAIAPITGTRYFTDWTMVNPFNGRIRDDIYYFIAPDGNVDTIVANYGLNSITLPSATKSGSSFGGWYYDSACTQPAGGPGDKITPTKDITLYAAWVDLKLYAVDNYTANGGKGAVDLSWTQSDNNNKVYKLYQSRDNVTWKQITSARDIASPTAIFKSLTYSGSVKTYTAPYAGIYTLTAWGAQGGSYGTYTGGKGGSVTARVWLDEGEVITYTIGGQNGYNGGGTGSSYGNGGGSTTVVSNRQGVLLVAGGGGGASENGNGGAGGSTASLRADHNSAGASGQAGGGAGYVGGNAGEYIVHHCNDDCYRQETITALPAAAFYTGATTEKTASSLSDFTAYNTNTYAKATGTMFHAEGYYTSKGTLTVGSSSNFLATPEAGTLKFSFNNDAANQAYRGRFNTPGYIIYVYDKDTNAVLHTINLDTAAHTSDIVKTKMCSGGTCYYGDAHKQSVDTWVYTDERITGTRYREYGLTFQNHDGSNPGWQDLEDINITCTLPIPASTNGVYIQVVESVNIDESLYIGAMISGVSFSYDSSTKICGYTDGQIISSRPAYGGSNYINTAAAYEYTQQSGVRSGNGAFSLKSEAIGFLEMLELKNVIATDYAAPDSISSQTVSKESMTGNQVKVNWQEPADNGTDYYHVAESYLTGSTAVLCKSNATKNTLISGIKGYYVLTNTSPSTVVNVSNGSFISGRSQTVSLGTQVKYLHVAAVDKAGNVGGTAHIRIEAEDIEWKLYTEQLVIEEAENVYPAGESKTWYVRADGEAPFTMQNRSYMDGIATEGYQPNHIIYEAVWNGESTRNTVYVPSVAVQSESIRTDAERLSHSTEGRSMLTQYPYSYAVRTDSNKKLLGVQSFTLSPEASGKRIDVIPIAGADKGSEVLYSNHSSDMSNRITIIGDGEAPVISGLDVLKDMKLIDRNEGSFVLYVNAMDSISGIREFYLEITNTDNGNSKIYSADSQNRIQIEITRDEPIFSGDFTVRAYAEDYVGNETEVDCATTEFALTVSLERILEPHDPIFKCGESGILTLNTYGYAEKVEVIFPPEMVSLQPDLNQIFDYSGNPSYLQQEEIQFMVPLYTPANTQYTITVIAYKGDKRLEEHPTFSTIAVEGSVLDEFRTRLR